MDGGGAEAGISEIQRLLRCDVTDGGGEEPEVSGSRRAGTDANLLVWLRDPPLPDSQVRDLGAAFPSRQRWGHNHLLRATRREG